MVICMAENYGENLHLKLRHYLALAEKSEYRYLRENAEELCEKLSGDV